MNPNPWNPEWHNRPVSEWKPSARRMWAQILERAQRLQAEAETNQSKPDHSGLVEVAAHD